MSSNTITPAPVLNRNSSDDEILGLVRRLPRRDGRLDTNGEGRESTAQIAEPRTNDQLEMDFDAEEAPKGTRRSSATNAEAAGTNGSGELGPDNLGEAL